MAQHTVVRWADLSEGLVLAPERYDPRRNALLVGAASDQVIRLGDLVTLERSTISANRSNGSDRLYLVLDTCDASEGILVSRKRPINVSELGSAKKLMKPGDVIISRLRPYLRQVAYIDSEFVERWSSVDEVGLLGSTEFFVLRSKNDNDIAYLASYLLAEPVQRVLNASQEGGHHPRFNQDTLLNLPVPEQMIAHQEHVSESIKRAISLYRKSEAIVEECVAGAEAVLA